MSPYLFAALLALFCSCAAGCVALLLGISIGQRRACEYFLLRGREADPSLATAVRLVGLHARDEQLELKSSVFESVHPICPELAQRADVLRPPWA